MDWVDCREDIVGMMRTGQRQLDHKKVEVYMEAFASIDWHTWIVVANRHKVDRRMTNFGSKRWKLLVC